MMAAGFGQGEDTEFGLWSETLLGRLRVSEIGEQNEERKTKQYCRVPETKPKMVRHFDRNIAIIKGRGKL